MTRLCIFRFGITWLALMAAGCASERKLDTSKSDLMPTEVAMQVFVRNGFGTWAKNPKLMKEFLCGGEWLNVKFEDIDRASFSTVSGKLYFFRSFESRGGICSQVVNLNVGTEAKANEIVNAAERLVQELNH